MSATPKDSESSETRFRFYASALTRKRTVTAEERERAINAAKTFEPDNPFCRVVLRPSYLYRGCIMYLPSCFTEKHLNGVSGFIKLQLSGGRQWPVGCLYRAGRVKLSQRVVRLLPGEQLGGRRCLRVRADPSERRRPEGVPAPCHGRSLAGEPTTSAWSMINATTL